MKAVLLADIKTPKGFSLYGVWFGPKNAKRVVVLVHGLGGSMLNAVANSFADVLAKGDTAVLSFNNRGYGIVNKIYKDAPKTKKGYTRIIGGSAHEVFEDCVDDLDGAVIYARMHGAKEVFIAGHSTGCQKSVYWAAKRKSAGVQGVILLAPVSDYAGMQSAVGAKKLAQVTAHARKMIASGKKHELLPQSVWPETIDAQRFVSLYSMTGNEEIFPYWDPKKNPKLLRSIGVPVLVMLAGADEYWDRPVGEVEAWFLEHLYTGEVAVIPDAPHSFHGFQKMVGKAIDAFMKERYN